MDRRAVLVALARHGLLTPENQLLVRAGGPAVVYAALVEAHAPAEVFRAAGMVPPVPDQDRPDDATVRQAVDLHLTLLGLDTQEIVWLSRQVADQTRLEDAWARLAAGDAPAWAHALPQRVGRLLALEGEAWLPLQDLISRGVWPYGPAADGRGFVVVMAAKPKDDG